MDHEEIFKLVPEPSEDKIKQTQTTAFKYLNFLKEPIAIYNQTRALNALKFTLVNLKDANTEVLVEEFLAYNLDKIYLDFAYFLFDKLIESYNLGHAFTWAQRESFLVKCYIIITSISKLCSNSDLLCTKLVAINWPKLLDKFIDNKILINHYLSLSKEKANVESFVTGELIKNSLIILIQIAKLNRVYLCTLFAFIIKYEKII